jgi:hypothetical protein
MKWVFRQDEACGFRLKNFRSRNQHGITEVRYVFVRYAGWFWIIVGVSVAYNIQIIKYKIKLLTRYENVTQRDLLIVESILQTVKQLQYARLS